MVLPSEMEVAASRALPAEDRATVWSRASRWSLLQNRPDILTDGHARAPPAWTWILPRRAGTFFIFCHFLPLSLKVLCDALNGSPGRSEGVSGNFPFRVPVHVPGGKT